MPENKELADLVSEDSIDYSRTWIRAFLCLAMLFVIAFIFIDKASMPAATFPNYLFSRLGFQVAPIFVGILLTYRRDYKNIYQPALFVIASVISLSNIYVIWSSWQIASFAFAYEGLMLYLYFYFFIARMELKYAIAHSILVNAAFISLLALVPIYGERNILAAGFTLTAHLIGVVGVYKLQSVLLEKFKYSQILFKYSITDSLTGLLNRKGYADKAEFQFSLCKRNQQELSLFIFDIDHFKSFNDNFGHAKGDEALEKHAAILSDVFMRDTDIIARFGGDEFLVVTSNTNASDCKALADKVLQRWQALEASDYQSKISCSIGCFSKIPAAEDRLEDFFEKADKALYQAKSGGKGKLVIYDKSGV